MDPKDWQKIKSVFNEAVEVPLSERHEFLREKFNGNDEMRFEVEKMLAFDDEICLTDEFEKNAFELFLGEDFSHNPEKIGEFKILREIGRGGMGAVYEAVRETDSFSQRVAIKVIKRGMDSEAILSRFRHEQKILSSLEHPNIARFLDGGMTVNDLPFYAMEYVEGEFIDDYCLKRNLNINERLELFRKVCDAVQFAHQNLIIHRDLKPKNILVKSDGTPKLLDFGIGKVLAPEEVEESGTATQMGMMTPAYASPEQIRGERIGTASDLYSLGVVLFEILTGTTPYRTKTKNQIEIQNAILETEPTKPSSVSGDQPDQNRKTSDNDAASLKLLRGDIDNIILKCLRKNPVERYSSVHEFSEDIKRHLEGLPVSARPLTLKYRAERFFVRNKIAVAAGFLVFISLVGGFSIAIWQAFEARKAEQVAQRRFLEVRELANNVVFKYHDAIAGLPGSIEARKMLVTDALKYLDSLDANSDDDPELQKELARAYLKMGDVQGKMYQANIGDTAGAIESYKKAVNLLENIVENHPHDIGAKEILISAYDDYAFLHVRSGNPPATKVMVEKAIALFDEVIANEPTNSKRKIQQIELLVRLGDVDTVNAATGKIDFGVRLDHHLKAVPLAQKFYESNSNSFEAARTLARVYQRIGTDNYWIGEKEQLADGTQGKSESYKMALEFHEKSFQMIERMRELEPENQETLRFRAIGYLNLAKSLAANGKFQEAFENADKNLAAVRANIAADKGNKELNLALSISLQDISGIYSRNKNYQKAIEFLSKSLTIDKAAFETDKKNLEVMNRIIESHRKMAEIYEITGERSKASMHFAESEKFIKSQKDTSNK